MWVVEELTVSADYNVVAASRRRTHEDVSGTGIVMAHEAEKLLDGCSLVKPMSRIASHVRLATFSHFHRRWGSLFGSLSQKWGTTDGLRVQQAGYGGSPAVAVNPVGGIVSLELLMWRHGKKYSTKFYCVLYYEHGTETMPDL